MLVRGLERYAGYMRYAQGAGRTAEGRRRGKRIPLEAVEGFGQRMSAAVIAAELRASERSARQCRPAANWRRQMRTVSAQTSGTRQDALDNRLRPLHPLRDLHQRLPASLQWPRSVEAGVLGIRRGGAASDHRENPAPEGLAVPLVAVDSPWS
jgi:hypothetical protein